MVERYIPGRGLVDQVVDPANPAATVAAEMTPGRRFMVGVGRGMKDLLQGGMRAGLAIAEGVGLQPEGSAEGFYQATVPGRERFERGMEGSTAATVGRIVGQTAPTFAVPVSAGAGVLGRIGQEAAIGGGLAALTAQPGADVLSEAGTGALFGGAASGLMSAAGAAGRPLVNYARGRLRVPASERTLAQSERFNVGVLAPDIAGRPNVEKASTISEQFLGGMMKPRLRQGEQAGAEAKALAGRLTREVSEPDKQIQESLDTAYKAVKQQARERYANDVLPRADALGSAPATATRAAAQRLLDEPNAKVIHRGYRKMLKDYADLEDMPFSAMHQMRADLNRTARGLYRKGDESQARIVMQMKGALEDDMKSIVQRSGDQQLMQGYREANQFFRDNVAPLRRRDIAAARDVDRTDADTIYRSFIKKNQGDKAQRFYNALDEPGRDAVRATMLSDALEKAVSTQGGRPVFSPAKFANSLNDIKDARNVFFNQAQREELNEFIDLMSTIKRAGQVGENPPTGARAIPLIGMGVGGGMGGAAFMTGDYQTAAGSVLAPFLLNRAFRQMMTGKTGKALLSGSTDRAITDPALSALVDAAQRQAARAAATEGNPEPMQ